jgi:hypothetical protein
VEYRIQEVIETKLRTILEEFGVDKTSDLLDSVEGNRMFDRLFVEALMHPDQVDAEAARIAENLRHDAGEDRGTRLLQGEGRPEGSELDAVSGQPLTDLLEMALRYHLESIDGRFEPQPDGSFLARWPDELRDERFRFPGAPEKADGELITLDHPKIRALLERLPVHGKGEPVPELTCEGLPKSVDGIWSLWVLRMSSFDFKRARVFPVYLNREGRPFPQTARHVWERLASIPLRAAGSLGGVTGLDAYETSHDAARSEGKSLWDEMEREHLRQWESERTKTQQHHAARRRLIERIGLTEVRQYRMRQLESEEASRLAELDSQRSLLPELEPLLILSLKPA